MTATFNVRWRLCPWSTQLQTIATFLPFTLRRQTQASILEGEVEAPKFPEVHHRRFKWGDFAALSYTWGNPSQATTVKVNDVPIRVTLNLKNALLMLRAQNFDTTFKVWIDALCINQGDTDEKTSQVSKMADIYSL
jgi:hypothetical protein